MAQPRFLFPMISIWPSHVRQPTCRIAVYCSLLAGGLKNAFATCTAGGVFGAFCIITSTYARAPLYNGFPSNFCGQVVVPGMLSVNVPSVSLTFVYRRAIGLK